MSSLSRKSRFISVEVTLKTNHGCDAFVAWFEAQGHFVHRLASKTHRWHVYFDPTPCSDANLTILRLCETISHAPPHVMKEWAEAEVREFFAGYEVGDARPFYVEHFALEALTAVADLKAGIGIAFYPAELTDERGISARIL